MASSLETFKAMFPELCSVDDNVVELWLTQADEYLCEDSWGKCFDTACLYLAAHELALSLQRQASAASSGGNAGGVVQSASADGLSVGYAVPNFATQGTIDETQYAKTPYGLKYLQLRDNCIAGGRLAGSVQNTATEQVIY